MELTFYKYQGTGNDFVMIDNRRKLISKNGAKLIHNLCDRRFGIGADGLILLEEAEGTDVDFKMVYFNADGRESSMCGNGGRCIVAFANFLGLVKTECVFTAIDGVHEGRVSEAGSIGLKMRDVSEITTGADFIFLDTGSPHHVEFAEGLDEYKVNEKGAAIRYSDTYMTEGGTNVNFVESIDESTLRIRTYERGVEEETLSCGTGATAAAIAAFSTGRVTSGAVTLKTEGGELQVRFRPADSGFTDIWLEGPAVQVFKGYIQC